MATQTTSTDVPVIPLGTWTVDTGSSKVGFEVPTMWGLVKVRGSFGRLAGNLYVEEQGAGGHLTIDAKSVDTKNGRRDKHLRSKDFFDVERHPEVVFAASSIALAANGVTITGDLRIGDVSQRLELPIEIERRDDRLRIRATTSLSRERAGLTWSMAGMIRGDADLTIDLELARENS
jgi:polyisoprenoid-binding protein YceI